MLARDQMAIVQKHQRKAPVQTVPIAKDLGLSVYRVDDWPNEVSGMIVANDERSGSNGYSIYVNAKHPKARRRFTIAHEISHFILHRHLIGDGLVEDALLRSEGLSNQVEAQANQMAADILMPWELIADLQETGVNSIEDLAQRLNVSNDAMSIRLLGVPYEKATEFQPI